MRVRVCSGWHPEGHVQYGRRFLASFDRYWPKEVELQVYTEVFEPMAREACRSLWTCPGSRELKEQLGQSARYQGREPFSAWKDKEVRAGYSYRFDAAKFWKQILIPETAATGLDDGDVLIWLDGDVETTAKIPDNFVDLVLPEGLDIAYLGREPKHSEIGFWAVRIDVETRVFLSGLANCYRTGEFKGMSEWHSAYVWDRVRERFNLREHNLCKPGARGHVWPNTILGQWTRHDKGKRKPGGKA